MVFLLRVPGGKLVALSLYDEEVGIGVSTFFTDFKDFEAYLEHWSRKHQAMRCPTINVNDF